MTPPPRTRTVLLVFYSLDDPTCRRLLDMIAASFPRKNLRLTALSFRRPSRATLRHWRPPVPLRRLPGTGGGLVRAFSRFLSEENPDLVHWVLLSRLSPRLGRALFRAAQRRAPMAASLHLLTPRSLPVFLRTGDHRRMAAVHAVSRSLARAAAERWPSLRGRIHVIRNGADRAYWSASLKPGKRSPPFLLTLSRLWPYKGLHVLIMAFQGLARRHPRLRLFIAGGRPRSSYSRQLKGLVRALGLGRRVTFTGEVSGERLRRLLKGCLVYVQPSLYESGCFAVMEACSAGVPVVATRTGSLEEVFRNGRDCLFVPPGDPRSLEKAVRRLLDDPGLRSRLARAGQRAAKAHDFKALSRRYAAFYEKCLP